MKQISILLLISLIVMVQSILITPVFLLIYNFILFEIFPETALREFLGIFILVIYLIGIREIYRRKIFPENIFQIDKNNIGKKMGVVFILMPALITAIFYSMYEAVFASVWNEHVRGIYYYYNFFSKIEFRSPLYVAVILYVTWWNTKSPTHQ